MSEPTEPTPAPEPTPEPAPEPETKYSPEVEAVFNFDPFERQPGTEPAPEPATTPAAPPPSPAAEAAPPPAPDPVAERIANIERATEVLQGLLARPQVQPAAAPPTPAEQEDPLPEYAFNVPPEVSGALFNAEDPVQQQQALGLVLRGVARSTHKMIREEYSQRIGALLEKVVFPKMEMEITNRLEQHKVYNDFYGKFPQYDTPELRSLVARELVGLMQAEKASAWSASIRDKLGARMVTVLGKLVPAPEVPAPVPPAAPPPIREARTRPAIQPHDGEVDEIRRTLWG